MTGRRRTQVNTPALTLPDKPEDQLQFGLFVDYGNVWQQRRLPDSPRDAELASVGVHASLKLGRAIDVSVDVGHQLIRAPFRTDRETRAAIVATIGF